MVILLLLELLLTKLTRIKIWVILFEIILIGLSLELTQSLLFPNVGGFDAWTHEGIVTNLLILAHIPANQSYSNLPIFHLVVGQTLLTTGLNYKFSAFFSVSFLQILCDVLFMFIIIRKVFNDKVGLIACLLLMTISYHIYFGDIAIPNTLGATLVLPILFLLFEKEKKYSIIILCLIFMGCLILTHTVSTMCLIIILIISWLGYHVYNSQRINGIKINLKYLSFGVIALFTIASFSWWIYQSGSISSLVINIKNMFISTALISPSILVNPSVTDQIVNQSGILLFFALSFPGIFYMVSKFGNDKSFIFALISALLLGIIVLSMLLGNSTLLGDRWLYFGSIFLSIPVAVTLVIIFNTTKKSYVSILLISMISGSMILLMIINPVANYDGNSQEVRPFFYQSELTAFKTLIDKSTLNIASDHYSIMPVINLYGKSTSEFVELDQYFKSKNYYELKGDLIVIRHEIMQDSFYSQNGSPEPSLNYNMDNTLNQQYYSCIYENNTVSAYIFNK
jgi:hypothetical protein